MFDRPRRWMGLVLAAILVATPALALAERRIVAIGDLHGDYEAYRAIIGAAGLLGEDDAWAGGAAILVQTGDIADRGPDSLRIMRDLMRLQEEAAAAGGRVVALVGNHEAMNATGDLRYAHPGEYAAFVDDQSRSRRRRYYLANQRAIEAAYRARDAALSEDRIRGAWIEATPLGAIELLAAWGPEGEIGRWLAGNPAAALIDGNLFVHGGIGAAYATIALDEINRRVTAALVARDEAPEAIINDPDGPLWYRGYLMREENDEDIETPPRLTVEQEVDAVLRAYSARRIVVGHTPRLEGIALLHGGRLIGIDTGIALHYGGVRSYLEIHGDEVVAHVVGEGDRL